MKLCMGCMNQIEEDLDTCPFCGFNESFYQQESYYLKPGSVVGGKYIVGKVLNYGGFTVSYLGMDWEDERKVVIKEYLPSDFSTRSYGEDGITIYSGDAQKQFEQGLVDFLNESDRIRTLANPTGIVRVFACFSQNDTGYAITEYLEGKTIKELLDSGKRFSAEEVKAFAQEILQGLCMVHPLNIIHCDISPETIIVTKDGKFKLLDFGAVRYVMTSNSKSLAIILKQGYASEEQYRSRGERGTWTDIYGLAAVMYHMLTGVVPQESVERALSDELKEPSRLGVAIPSNMENAIMNALNVFQEERTPDAQSFLQELMAPSVKRIRVKKRRKDTGKFPVWAKILVAGLFCIVIAGAGLLWNLNQKNSGNFVSEESMTLRDYSGETIESVKNSLKQDGYDIHINIVEEFNANEKLNGIVFRQNPTAEADLEANLPTGWKISGDGVVKGKITFYVYTNEIITYREISNLSAYSLAKKLDWDISGSYFAKTGEVSSAGGQHDYFDIADISLQGGRVITADDLKSASMDDSIRIDEIEKIDYYADDFFYWESLDNYVGQNINTVECALYEKMDENSLPRRTGRMRFLKDSNLVDKDYYSFVEDEGIIFKQTIDSGSTVNASEGVEKIFHVVGTKLSFNGKTGKKLLDELSSMGYQYIEYTGSRDGSQEILGVTVFDRKSGEEVKVFRLEQNVRFEIRTKDKPQPVKKPGSGKNDKEQQKVETPTSESSSGGTDPSPSVEEKTPSEGKEPEDVDLDKKK